MDHYAELELPPDATPEDIKRQYRKLILQYHPDKNPGKEAEVAPRFQAISQAHDVLLDPEQRRKYDLSRQRGNLHNSFPRQPNNSSRRRDPNTFGAFDPPPKRDDPRYPPRRPEPSRFSTQPPPNVNGTGGGASRYARFPNAPPPSTAPNTSSKQDAKARANVFNAWQNMHHTSKPQGYRPDAPQPPPRRPAHGPAPDLPPRSDIPPNGAFGRERPTSSERPNPTSRGRPGYRVPPYFDRSATSPRDATGQAAPNPATDNINAMGGGHVNPNFVPPPFYKGNAHPPPQQDEPEMTRDRMRRGPPRSNSREDIPYSEGAHRHSTPYTANVHERTKVDNDPLRRSSSTRDTRKWAQDAARRSREGEERQRPRSLGRTPEGSRTRSRPSSAYSGVEVEEEDSSVDGEANSGTNENGQQANFLSGNQRQQKPQPSPNPQSDQRQQQQPLPEEMDIDPPPTTGLDSMQDMSQDLPRDTTNAPSSNETNGDPLNSMADMATDLPPKNSNSSFKDNPNQRPPHSDMPKCPMAPQPPHPLSPQTWSIYLKKFSAYMSAWNTFNGKMVSHFQDSALRSEDRMKGPAGGMVEGWLGAAGGTDGLGDWSSYYEGVQHDNRIRHHWNVACGKHAEAVEKHARIRARVLQGELGG